MKIRRINLNGKPRKRRKRGRAYARNPKKTFDDPVFKASEAKFYAPDYDGTRTVLCLRRENGKFLREGCIESVRYIDAGGRELVEFTCSPTASAASPALFRAVVEAECIEKQTQKRTVKPEHGV